MVYSHRDSVILYDHMTLVLHI